MADKDETGPDGRSTPASGSHAFSADDLAAADGAGNGTASDAEFDALVADADLASGTELGDPGLGGTDETSRDDADDDALEPAGVAARRSGGSTPVTRPRRPARAAKTAPTPSRDRSAQPERTTPVRFVRQSVGELRKVVYPTSQQLLNYFVVVLVFVLFVIAYVSLLDLGFGALIFRIFS